MPTSPDAAQPLLVWDFDNVMSDSGVSIAVGVPSNPQAISGFVSQTGGGPAEVFGDIGTVFLTRHLGTNDAFMWFTVTRPMFFASLTFQHWHNHNPGFPTHPKYRVQLQLDSGDGYANIGDPLELKSANSGGTDTIEVGRELEPGSYKLRWYPKGLKNKAQDTSSEFFAIKNLALNGRVLAGVAASGAATSEPTPCAMPAPEPKAAALQSKIGDFISVEIAGVTVEKLKVMESKYGGKCSRSGEKFEPGATIAFKHRDALTDEQKTAIFGTKKPAHLMVLIPTAEAAASATEAPTGGEPVCCTLDATRLEVFRSSIAEKAKGDEWLYGNLSSKSVAYSCGHLTRGKLDHRHDPAELALCQRIASETSSHLLEIKLNDESTGAPFLAYFAAAVIGAPVPTAIDEAFVRSLFGDTISEEVPVDVEPMNNKGRWWQGLVDNHWIPAENAILTRSWNAFMKWFRAVPGLREHSFVLIGAGDDEPGCVKPRLVVALTAAGSLVGAASSVVYA